MYNSKKYRGNYLLKLKLKVHYLIANSLPLFEQPLFDKIVKFDVNLHSFPEDAFGFL